jgi:hypothetical protein
MFQGTTAHSGETWQQLMELRCQREVIEGWLAISALSDDIKQNLRAKNREVDDRLQALTKRLSMSEGKRL